MRRGTVVNIKGYKFFDFIAKNNILIVLVVFLIIGIATGTFTVARFKGLTEYSASYLEKYISERSETTFLFIAVNSFTTSLLVLILTFAAGASMLGVVLVPIIAAFRGFLYGCVTSYLYSEYAVKGIAFNAVIMIPSTIVFIIALLLAARESVKFSLVIARMTMPKSVPANLYIDFKNYCGRYMFLCIIVIVSALIDAVLSSSFMSYFNL